MPSVIFVSNPSLQPKSKIWIVISTLHQSVLIVIIKLLNIYLATFRNAVA